MAQRKGEETAPVCGAKRRGEGGGTCGQPAGWGTEHPGFGRCKLHFGNNKSAKVKAAVATLETQANKLLGTLKGMDPIDDPLTELSKIAAEVVRWKDVIAERVSFLKDVSYESETTGEQIRGQVIVLERALDRCVTVLTAMARLDIDERLVKISEAQAAMVEQALDYALRSTGLSVAKRAEARRHVAERLRLVSGDTP